MYSSRNKNNLKYLQLFSIKTRVNLQIFFSNVQCHLSTALLVRIPSTISGFFKVGLIFVEDKLMRV